MPGPTIGHGAFDPDDRPDVGQVAWPVSDRPDVERRTSGSVVDDSANAQDADDPSILDRVGGALDENPTALADGIEFSRNGPVWTLGLNDERTKELAALLKAGSPLAIVAGPQAVAGLAAAAEYIKKINELGGNNGVDIIGVIGTSGLLVTPRLSGILQQALTLAKLAVSGRTIMDFIVHASGGSAAFAQTMQFGVVGSIYNAVASGTPLGWALAVGIGVVEKVLFGEDEPDINAHGAVHADRDQVQEWESFLLGTVDGDHSALLSWQGFFSAQFSGGAGVFANRPEVGEWETWRVIDNHDGTVSLQTFDGHYLCAEEGGGRECQADRTQIGDWERFVLENLPGGKVALRTLQQGKYVSVQRDSQPD